MNNSNEDRPSARYEACAPPERRRSEDGEIRCGASTNARTNAAFVRLGLSGCDIRLSYFLPRLVGAAVTRSVVAERLIA
jgi:hypothetical protein